MGDARLENRPFHVDQVFQRSHQVDQIFRWAPSHFLGGRVYHAEVAGFDEPNELYVRLVFWDGVVEVRVPDGRVAMHEGRVVGVSLV